MPVQGQPYDLEEGCGQSTPQCAPHIQALRNPPHNKIGSAAQTDPGLSWKSRYLLQTGDYTHHRRPLPPVNECNHDFSPATNP